MILFLLCLAFYDLWDLVNRPVVGGWDAKVLRYTVQPMIWAAMWMCN